MREIKFRAWDTEIKKMIYNREVTELYGGIDDYFRVSEKHEMVVWMEYTGLHDKDGKEIFEGDIVQSFNKIRDWKIKKHNLTAQVYYDGAQFLLIPTERFKLFGSVVLRNRILQVIGNVYENHELLNSVKE